jgi:glucose/galactose transporter
MNSSKKQFVTSMIIIGVLFFLFGFITWLNGILIPYLKIACELNNLQSLMVAFSFYIAYFVMAIPSGWVLKKTGFKKGMMFGLWIMALGALVFIPAAFTRSFPLFLFGLFIMGTGLTVLQNSSNPYITIIGPVETAASRISIMGICNKIAGALAPIILAYFILNDGDSFVESLKTMAPDAKSLALDALAARAIAPYTVIAISLFLLGIMMRYSPLPEIENEDESEIEKDSNDNEVASIFHLPHLWMGAIALFFYVGVEVIAGDTIIRYGMLLGIDIADAKIYTSYTLVAMIVGYVLIGLILIPKIISQRVALVLSAILGIAFTLAAIFTSGPTSVFFIAMLGFANAIVWPAIWPLAIHNTGKHIKTASSLLIMAIAGGATLPLIWGAFADYFAGQPQNAYWICIPCYLIIFYFSMWGYKLKPRSVA